MLLAAVVVVGPGVNGEERFGRSVGRAGGRAVGDGVRALSRTTNIACRRFPGEWKCSARNGCRPADHTRSATDRFASRTENPD